MSRNLNRHIKSDKAKWAITGIVLVLIIIMLVGMCLQLFGRGKVRPSEWFKKEVVEEAFDVKIEDNSHVLMSQGETYAVVSDEIKYLETTVTATILPEDATNKNVQWTIEWYNSSEDNISDSWTLTANGLTATIRLLRSAPAAKVTVITEDGGFSAWATVMYDDVPIIAVPNIEATINQNRPGDQYDNLYYECKDDKSFDLPLYSSEGLSTTIGAYDTQNIYRVTLFLYNFFGNKVVLYDTYDDLFKKLSVKPMLSGQRVSSSVMNVELGTYGSYSNRNLQLIFIFKDDFNELWRTNKDTLNFNVFYDDKEIGSVKVNFTVPVASVSLSDSQIIL